MNREPTSGETSASPQATRVLLAEDQDALRRLLARSLGACGHVVVEAHDGREAAGLVRRERFDVIVSDISMPGMSGLDLLRAVRERDFDVPVVLMTGSPDVETAVKAVELGAFKYLTKPVQLASLEQTVARAAQLHRMARMKREALALLGSQADRAGDRAGLEASFARAFASLWMAYQPIVRAADGNLYGYEALLRSDEPALPHPGAVLDAAEKLDRLDDLGRHIRARAAAPIAAAIDRGFVFVNLHPRDLSDGDLTSPEADLSRIASRVVLEITERASLDETKGVRTRVAELREMGYRIAIDDLGAGYAGLTSFATLEPEIVKLDMSLVRDVHNTPTKQKLIRAMTTVCKDMGMLVVAEGVETMDERAALVDLGCDLLQGYLLAKPGRPFPDFVW